MSAKQYQHPGYPKPPNIPNDPDSIGLPGDHMQDHERYEYVTVPQTDLSGQEDVAK